MTLWSLLLNEVEQINDEKNETVDFSASCLCHDCSGIVWFYVLGTYFFGMFGLRF